MVDSARWFLANLAGIDLVIPLYAPPMPAGAPRLGGEETCDSLEAAPVRADAEVKDPRRAHRAPLALAGDGAASRCELQRR
jgi:hypothetical protein